MRWCYIKVLLEKDKIYFESCQKGRLHFESEVSKFGTDK